jgi:hypothetical protein
VEVFMNVRFGARNRIAVGMGVVATLPVALIPFGSTRRASAAAASDMYHQTNLVSDLPGVALIQDLDLVNPWGISMSASSPFWVANNGSGTSTLYAGDVNGSPFMKNALVVTTIEAGTGWGRRRRRVYRPCDRAGRQCLLSLRR